MSQFSLLISTLDTALSLKRQHGSMTEAMFAAWLVNRVTPSMIDGGGNIHVTVGTSRTIFTSHLDTVHHGEGENLIRKTDTHWYADGAALGADDGCGIALMLHMIAASVPGRYIFFRGEECGGIGSSWLAENMPGLLSAYDRAIAFDRAGLGDVITHQSGGRCCSDEFAIALSDAMNLEGLMYSPCNTGVYTDTAEFTHIIPECTNLSVGYDHQHGDKEELNLRHFVAVASVVTVIDWENLPTTRDPKNKEPRYSSLDAAYPTYSTYTGISSTNEYWLAAEALDAAIIDKDFSLLTELMIKYAAPSEDSFIRLIDFDKTISEDTLVAALHKLDAGESDVADIIDGLTVIAYNQGAYSDEEQYSY